MKSIRHREKRRRKTRIKDKKQRQLFYIVKRSIDLWDPYCLLRKCGCPPDEFNYESEMVTKLITEDSSFEEINMAVSEVFSKMFFPEHFQPYKCIEASEMIYRSLQEQRRKKENRNYDNRRNKNA